MSTVVVVRKRKTVCIAADSLTTFGSLLLNADNNRLPSKILAAGDSYLGLVGSAAHQTVIESLIAREKSMPALKNHKEIFEFFRSRHTLLKEEYFLNPSDEDDDPYESSQFTILIANPYGIFAIHSFREVHEFSKFWAVGSGDEIAMGAMYALYDRLKTAEEIAMAGVEAGIALSSGSAGPVDLFTIKLRG